MIVGVVTSTHEARLTLRIRNPTGDEYEFESVIDTGFTAFLTLPANVVAQLSLPFVINGYAFLADGSKSRFTIHKAEVLWGTAWRSVLVSAIGRNSLLGMRMLAGHDLHIAVEPGGEVSITPIATP